MSNNTTGKWGIRFSIMILWSCLSLVLATGVAHAQKAPRTPKPQGDAAKICSLLGNVLAQAKVSAKPALLSNELVKVNEAGEVQVYVRVSDCSDATVQQLAAAGLKVELVNAGLCTIQGWLPLGAVQNLASLAVVQEITNPGYPKYHSVGSAGTQGDGILHANWVHDAGDRGANVKVGLISDCLTSLSQAQASGDLPATIDIDPTHPGVNYIGNSGTALLEIVHDIAPLSSLAFSGPATSLEFLASVNWMVNTAHCDVVVDDVAWFDEPYFEDGPLAQAVAAVAGSVVYISAAGNDNGFHYSGGYTDVDTTKSSWPNNLHAFSGKDVTMQVVIPAHTTMYACLQWANKFGLADDDYDLYLYNNSDTKDELASSNGHQTGTQNPYEGLFYTNSGSSPLTANIMINKVSGIAQILDLYVYGVSAMQFASNADTIFGHTAAANVLSVGAVNAATTSTIASYSSQGPSTLFFPGIVTRQTPTFVAVDGVSVSGAGCVVTTFRGTSAAAAHAAGVAALVKSANPTFTADAIATRMKSTAADLGAAGFDNIYGNGLIDAFRASGLTRNPVSRWMQYR